MNGKAHQLGRIVAGLALVASIAMLAAQSAAAVDGRSPDTRAAAEPAGGGIALDVRSPDTRQAAAALSTMHDARIQVSSTSGPVTDVRSPDTREATPAPSTMHDATIQVSTSSGPVTDVRSPDTRDAAGPAPASAERTLASSSEGLDWGDFGLGAGIATASLLLVAVLAAAGMSGRRRSPTTV